MVVRTPLKINGSNLQQMTSAEISNIKSEAARLFGLNPSIGLSVVTSGGSLGTLSDTRLIAGAMSTSSTSIPTIATTQNVSTTTVNYSKINLTEDTSASSDWTNASYSYPLYYDNGNLREMSPEDFGDTFIKPAIDLVTGSSTQPGTYFISTVSGGITGSTLVSATPIFTDTRYNLPTLSSTALVEYEIIGGGGEGAGGYTGTGPGAAGTSSSIASNSPSFTTIVSAGGAGGVQPGPLDANNFRPGEAGEASYYGPGGAGGANSNSNNQTPGYSAPASSYGAGGGGGGSYTFAAQNGGGGGKAAVRQTGTRTVNVGSSITVTIGSGGAAISGGGNGAGGYAKIIIGGTVYEYTTPGTYTINVTNATYSLPFTIDDPVTISNYYLYRKNGDSTTIEYPLPVCYTKSGINLYETPSATFTSALETMIRYYARAITGTKISYNINGAGIVQGTAMTDTKLNSSQYLTQVITALDSYRAQEIPAGSASTISTYSLKITQI